LIGINVSSSVAADWGAVIHSLNTWTQQKYYPLFAIGWAPDFNDPDDYARPLLVPGPTSSDWAHVNDAYVNTTIEYSLNATTVAQRQTAYNNLTNYVQNTLYPWIFLHQGHLVQVWTDNLAGYVMNIMDQCYFYACNFPSTAPGSGTTSVPGFDVALIGMAAVTASLLVVVLVRKKIRV